MDSYLTHPLKTLTAIPSISCLKKFSRHGHMHALMLVTSFTLLTVLTGCHKPEPTLDDGQSVKILRDKVVIDSSLVLTSNPERYQPSYNLRGVLVPITEKTVSSPYNAHHPELLVQVGDWVTKNQPLVRLHSELSKAEVDKADYDFVEITTDADLEAQSQNKAASTDSILPDEIEQTLTNVANVFKNDAKKTADTEAIATESSKPKTSAKDDTEHTPINKAAETKPSTPKDKQISQLDKVKNASETDNLTTNNSTNIKIATDKPTSNKPAVNKSNKNDDVTNAKQAQALTDDTASKSAQQKEQTPAINKQLSTKASNNRKVATTLTLKSPIAGEVTKIEHIKPQSQPSSDTLNNAQNIASNTTLITLADTHALQLIGKLPLSTQSQLSVGSPVNFTIHDDIDAEFAGQISHVIPKPKKGYLVVRAPVLPSSENKVVLKPGMHALMTIEYGQMELAVRLPRKAIHEAVLGELNENHTRPVSPIRGYVWVIEQNHRLTYTPIEVVQYFPKSDQFLVHGVNNDSLICLANLPKDSEGKTILVD